MIYGILMGGDVKINNTESDKKMYPDLLMGDDGWQ